MDSEIGKLCGNPKDYGYTTLFDETINSSYSALKYSIVNGTVDTSGAEFVIECPQVEIATGSNLLNGTANTGITKLTFDLSVYGKSILVDCDLVFKVKILTTPTVGRRYFGAGVDGNGYRNPVDGGFLFCASTTLANNAVFSKDQENARVALGQALVLNDELEITARIRGAYTNWIVTKNGNFLGNYRYNGSNENDNLARSCGQFCIYGYAMNFSVSKYKVIDVMPKNSEINFLGDSNGGQGWGVISSNYMLTSSRLVKSHSTKVIGIYSRSSLMMRDAVDVLHEALRTLRRGGLLVVRLGTNDALQNRTLAEMQADTLALINFVNNYGKAHRILFKTIPPISPSGTQNTKTHDFSEWLKLTFNTYEVGTVDTRSVLITPSTILWDDKYRSDLYHLNENGYLQEFEYLKTYVPELF